jgi:hypothetical protein
VGSDAHPEFSEGANRPVEAEGLGALKDVLCQVADKPASLR